MGDVTPNQQVEMLRAAILDIDAHATPLGEDADGFATGGYVVSVGALHRALGLVGHTASVCRQCSPESHDCPEASDELRALIREVAALDPYVHENTYKQRREYRATFSADLWARLQAEARP